MPRTVIAAAVVALALLGAPAPAFADIGNDGKTDPPAPADHVKHHDYTIYSSPGNDGKAAALKKCQDNGIDLTRQGAALNYYCRYVEPRTPGPNEPAMTCGTICPDGTYELWIKPGRR